MTTFADSHVVRELMQQVTLTCQAIDGPASELDVVTFITRPMWNAWLRWLDLPENSEPTPYLGIHSIRVFGSETHVIESDEMWSISVSRFSLTKPDHGN